MSILKVLNVGQGDSMILTPPQSCQLNDQILLIDLGPGGYDVTNQITSSNKIHIFITHHDADHLAGIKFLINKMNQVQEITVPFYQNEITLIAQALLRLKGIRDARDCGEFIRLLEDIVGNQIHLNSLARYPGNGPKFSFAWEGTSFCAHIKCLNPPLFMNTVNWLKEISPEDLTHIFNSIFNSIFEPAFAQNISTYMYARMNGAYDTSNSPEIMNITLPEPPNNNDLSNSAEVNIQKSSYVIDFIMQNMKNIQAFNENPSRSNMRKLYTAFVKCAHDVCLVLRADFHDSSFLLAGDASKKVFNRLIRNKVELQADYLKVPHHGSKYNMNQTILNKINPKFAIISHNNRRFGKATDPHPNIEVLDLLARNNIQILLTNDVYKQDVLFMQKEYSYNDGVVEIK